LIRFPKDLEGASIHPEDFIAPLIKEDGEIMKALLSEPDRYFAKHALTLLCQASPSLCNVFKHVRANANAAREWLQETIQSLEGKVPGFEIISKSEIIRDCLREEIEKGTHPGKALRKCFSRTKLKGALGEWADELDLSKEIARWLKLDKDQEKRLREALRPVKITSKGIEFRDHPSKLQKRFRERVRVWKEWIRKAIEDPGRASREVLGEMVKLGFTSEDIGRMAAVSDWVKDRYVSSFSHTVALVETEREAAEVDGWLDRLDRSVGVKEYLKGPARQLRTEMQADLKTIRRRTQAALRLQRAVTALRKDVDQELERRLFLKFEGVILAAREETYRQVSRPWGELPK
jgi:hypothetical protein